MTSPSRALRAGLHRELAANPSKHALQRRLAALQRLREDIDRFVSWPALAQSIQQDEALVRNRMRNIT